MKVFPDDRLLYPASERHADAGGGQSAGPSPGQILIVDDNQDAADSLAMLLEYLGRTVRVANSGQAALDMLQDFKPQVILMDIGMPGMDGLEAARRIREQPALTDATLIALSGWGQEEDKRRATESGFDHHLTKPVDLRMLETLLADAGKRG